MSLVVGCLLGIVLLVLGLRQWLLRRECPQRATETFDGVVYRVGRAAIAERRCEHPRVTVIAMHGFIEDLRYFTRYYSAPEVQFIGLTSCDYHVPITGPRYQSPAWARVPSAPAGSISYDAEVLLQALEHLPKAEHIRVHGHSRGGAVVLEAASLRPDLFRNVEVVLEAPVLPQGRSYRSLTAVQRWLLAFFVPLWRREPISRFNRGAFGALEDARKRELIEGLPFTARRVTTMMANLDDLAAWMEARDASLYAHVQRGVVLVPGKDKVLEVRAMQESARKAEPRLRVIQLDGCSHFVLMDRPDALPPLAPMEPRSAAAS